MNLTCCYQKSYTYPIVFLHGMFVLSSLKKADFVYWCIVAKSSDPIQTVYQ